MGWRLGKMGLLKKKKLFFVGIGIQVLAIIGIMKKEILNLDQMLISDPLWIEE